MKGRKGQQTASRAGPLAVGAGVRALGHALLKSQAPAKPYSCCGGIHENPFLDPSRCHFPPWEEVGLGVGSRNEGPRGGEATTQPEFADMFEDLADFEVEAHLRHREFPLPPEEAAMFHPLSPVTCPVGNHAGGCQGVPLALIQADMREIEIFWTQKEHDGLQDVHVAGHQAVIASLAQNVEEQEPLVPRAQSSDSDLPDDSEYDIRKYQSSSVKEPPVNPVPEPSSSCEDNEGGSLQSEAAAPASPAACMLSGPVGGFFHRQRPFPATEVVDLWAASPVLSPFSSLPQHLLASGGMATTAGKSTVGRATATLQRLAVSSNAAGDDIHSHQEQQHSEDTARRQLWPAEEAEPAAALPAPMVPAQTAAAVHPVYARGGYRRQRERSNGSHASSVNSVAIMPPPRQLRGQQQQQQRKHQSGIPPMLPTTVVNGGPAGKAQARSISPLSAVSSSSSSVMLFQSTAQLRTKAEGKLAQAKQRQQQAMLLARQSPMQQQLARTDHKQRILASVSAIKSTAGHNKQQQQHHAQQRSASIASIQSVASGSILSGGGCGEGSSRHRFIVSPSQLRAPHEAACGALAPTGASVLTGGAQSEEGSGNFAASSGSASEVEVAAPTSPILMMPSRSKHHHQHHHHHSRYHTASEMGSGGPASPFTCSSPGSSGIISPHLSEDGHSQHSCGFDQTEFEEEEQDSRRATSRLGSVDEDDERYPHEDHQEGSSSRCCSETSATASAQFSAGQSHGRRGHKEQAPQHSDAAPALTAGAATCLSPINERSPESSLVLLPAEASSMLSLSASSSSGAVAAIGAGNAAQPSASASSVIDSFRGLKIATPVPIPAAALAAGGSSSFSCPSPFVAANSSFVHQLPRQVSSGSTGGAGQPPSVSPPSAAAMLSLSGGRSFILEGTSFGPLNGLSSSSNPNSLAFASPAGNNTSLGGSGAWLQQLRRTPSAAMGGNISATVLVSSPALLNGSNTANNTTLAASGAGSSAAMNITTMPSDGCIAGAVASSAPSAPQLRGRSMSSASSSSASAAAFFSASFLGGGPQQMHISAVAQSPTAGYSGAGSLNTTGAGAFLPSASPTSAAGVSFSAFAAFDSSATAANNALILPAQSPSSSSSSSMVALAAEPSCIVAEPSTTYQNSTGNGSSVAPSTMLTTQASFTSASAGASKSAFSSAGQPGAPMLLSGLKISAFSHAPGSSFSAAAAGTNLKPSAPARTVAATSASVGSAFGAVAPRVAKA